MTIGLTTKFRFNLRNQLLRFEFLTGLTFLLITALIASFSNSIDSSFAAFEEKNGNVNGKLYLVGTLSNNDSPSVSEKEQIISYIEKGNNSYSEGSYDEAIEYFDNALGIDPSDTMALFKKGSTLNELGRYEEATAYFDKVTEYRSSTHWSIEQ